MNPLDELGGSTGKAFFNKNSVIGETVTGTILSATVRQINDFQTGKPKFWDDGKPQNQVVITIQTALREDADDEGERSLYVKTWGSQWKALQEAVRALGVSKLSEALAPGNIITETFTGTKTGGNGFDEKLFAFQIKRGADPALDTVNVAAPVASPDPWAQQPAQPVQQAAAPVQQAAPQLPTDVPAAIRAGWDDQTIATTFGADLAVIAAIRQQLAAA